MTLGALLVPAVKVLLALLSFATTIMITRTLGTEAYGVYATAINLALMLASLVGHTLDAGVFRLVPNLLQSDRGGAERLLREAFGLRMSIGVALVAALALPAALAGSALLKSPDWPLLALLVAAGVLAMLAFGQLQVQLQVSQRFHAYLTTDAAQVLGRLGLVAALLGWGALTLPAAVATYVLVPLAVFVCGWLVMGQTLAATLPHHAQSLREFVGDGKWVLLSVALHTVYTRLDLLMLSSMADGHAAGIYGAALNLATVPELLASFVLVVLYPKVVPLRDSGRFAAALRRFLLWFAPLALAGVALVMLVADQVIHLLYTAEFAEAAPVLRVLIVGSAFWFLLLPLAAPYITLTNPRRLVAYESLAFVATVAGNLLLIPRWGALGAAFVLVGVRLVLGTAVFAFAWQDAPHAFRLATGGAGREE